MVLFNATSFISLIALIALSLPVKANVDAPLFDEGFFVGGVDNAIDLSDSSLLAQSSKSEQSAGVSRKSAEKKVASRRRPQISRVGLAFITVPQEARLLRTTGSVGAGEQAVATESNGLVLTYDRELRIGRWMLAGSAGLGVSGIRAASMDSSNIAYEYSKNTTLLGTAAATFFWVTSPNVRVGMGLRGYYSDAELPEITSNGSRYSFEYGTALKSFATVDLNWQLNRRWLFSQSFLHPVTKQVGSGWLLAVKRSF